MTEKYASVQAMKRGYGYGCVYVCVIINQISSRQLLVCACVCYQSTSGRAVNARTICVCVRAHVRLRVGMSVCMCVCPASSLSCQQLLVCMGIRYHFNTKYFIINSKITALCNRNRSAVLAYIYTQVAVDSRVMMPDTHTYTHSCPPLILRVYVCTNTHTYGARICSPSRSALITHTHTHK